MPDGFALTATPSPAGVVIMPLRERIGEALQVLQDANRRPDGSVPDRYATKALWDHLYDSVHCRLPDRPRFLVAVAGDRLVGVGGYRHAWISAHGWELAYAAVDPAWQGRGVGAALLRARLAAIRWEADAEDFVLVHSRRPASMRRYGFASCAVDASVMLARVGSLVLPAAEDRP